MLAAAAVDNHRTVTRHSVTIDGRHDDRRIAMATVTDLAWRPQYS